MRVIARTWSRLRLDWGIGLHRLPFFTQKVAVVLLGALVASAERAGIWTVQTGIFPENQASVRLHRACGFRVVGVRERLGRLHGRWRDVVLLERRSPAIT